MADVRQSDTINSMIQLNIPRKKILVEIVRKPSPSPLRIWVKEDECLDDSQPRTPLHEGRIFRLLSIYIITHIVSVVVYLYLYKIIVSVDNIQ